MSTDARLLLLPGNNPDQRAWIEALHDELAPLFRHASILYYQHWNETDAPYIDLERELPRLVALSADLPCVIVAKSAGVLLTLMAAARGVLVPERTFFLGSPFSWSQQQGMPVTDLLAGFPAPAVFVQQTEDPGCPLAELRPLLRACSMARYVIEEIPGASHHYDDLPLVRALVEKHLFGKQPQGE